MLVCEIATEVRVRPLRSLGSSSRPTRNMNSTSPTWASICNSFSESAGNSAVDTSGRSQPSSDGPSMMPAATSAITIGCPMRRIATPSRRDTVTMTITCANRRVSGLPSRVASIGAVAAGRAPARTGKVALRR